MPEVFPDRPINSQAGRYSYEIVPGETPVFRKTISNPEIAHLIQGEKLWHDFMQHMQQIRPDLQVRSPGIIDYRPNNSIDFEYIEAPFLAKRDNHNGLVHHTEKLADIMVAIDTVAASWTPTVTIDPEKERAPYFQIDRRWDAWLERPLQQGLITQPQIEEARHQVRRLEHLLQPRLQHGDFTPWHIFVKGDEWIIYDAEHASPLKPRFYDLAYCYTRVFTLLDDKEAAFRIVQAVSAKIDMEQDDFLQCFLPVVTSRSIGMFVDALNDREEIDYTEAAQELYHRCMDGSWQAMTAD